MLAILGWAGLFDKTDDRSHPMRKPVFDASWPALFKACYDYDESEVWGGTADLGHRCQYRNRREPILAAIEELLPAGSTILDSAAAQGNFTLPLAEKGYHMVWNDLRSDLIDWVKMKHESGTVEYVAGNIFEKSAAFHERFDAVIATEVIEHVAHPDQFLAAIAAMVRPGGWIFMTTPNGRYFRNALPKFSDCTDPSVFEALQFAPDADGHIFLLHPSEIVEMSKAAGLRIHKLFLVTNSLSAGHVKLRHVQRVLPQSVVDSVESATQSLPWAMRERLHTSIVAIFQKA